MISSGGSAGQGVKQNPNNRIAHEPKNDQCYGRDAEAEAQGSSDLELLGFNGDRLMKPTGKKLEEIPER
jgi:hypothetical protein